MVTRKPCGGRRLRSYRSGSGGPAGVVERLEIDPERGGGQPVREVGVLGKQRTVEIGAHHGAVRAAAHAFVAAAAVVAVAFEDSAERFGGRAEARTAAVVLE